MLCFRVGWLLDSAQEHNKALLTASCQQGLGQREFNVISINFLREAVLP